jgi:cytochrome oxidase Cu insertion factor (SCO1/SenC/PrrC family)
VKHNSIVPWLVALVCFGPFAAAMFVYYGLGPDSLPQLSGSRELLENPVPLPPEWRAGTGTPPAPWQLIYARMTPCEEQCVAHLGRLMQVQLALGRDQNRVRRAVWHVGPPPPLEDPGLTVHALDDAEGREIAAALGPERLGEGRVYVADPRGDVILSYPPDVEQKELLRDLKRLLSGSDS